MQHGYRGSSGISFSCIGGLPDSNANNNGNAGNNCKSNKNAPEGHRSLHLTQTGINASHDISNVGSLMAIKLPILLIDLIKYWLVLIVDICML